MPGGPSLLDTTEEQWDDVVNTVFRGVFFSGKHAARQMKKQGSGGNIVVTTSAAGINAYPVGFGAYAAGKAGAIGLVHSMATEWGKYGIRVNGLAPTHGMSINFALPLDAPVLNMSYEEFALQQSGGEWTDDGSPRERRQLKHRAEGDSRIVPAHPELTRLLRDHLAEVGDHQRRCVELQVVDRLDAFGLQL